jgi:D-alanine--poly(phosphoribitol) ligase subunit 1
MLEMIKNAVRSFPDRTAYSVDGNGIGYKDMWKLSCEYGDCLKRQGTAPVIVYGHKSTGMVTAILSCLIAGRAYIPIEAGTPVYRIENIISAAGATLIVCEEPLSGMNTECTTVEGLKRYAGLPVQESDNDTAYIIFTSGSTGEPKGVPISRDNLNNFVSWISGLEPLNGYKGVKVFNQSSFSFDLSVADLYYSICNGNTLISFTGNITEDYEGFAEVFSEAEIAVVTPSFIRMCLLDYSFNAERFRQLKCIYFCGERLEPVTVMKLYEAFPDIKIINAYGPTEATSAVSAVMITRKMAEDMPLLPVGDIMTAAADIEIQAGEIVLKGKSVFGGYLGGAQGGHFTENGVSCYRTGDIGYIENGLLYCKGRTDSQIKYAGYRIELQEIECNINRIDGVNGSAVIASYDENGTVKAIKAYVEAGPALDPRTVRRELAKRIPRYMIPKSVKILESLPVTVNGKIDRKALERL